MSLDAVGRARGFWDGAELRCRHGVRGGAGVHRVEVRSDGEVRRCEVCSEAEVRRGEVCSDAEVRRGERCLRGRGGSVFFITVATALLCG